MKEYHKLLQHILDNGVRRDDRTGTSTIGVFGYQMRFNLQDGFPLVTTKKIHIKSVIHELLWFLSGDTNIKYLKDNGVRIWDEWADENGDLGPVYGKQWRDFNGVDQITELIDSLINDPNSRRHILTAWNPSDIPNMKLPPCHCFSQFYVQDDRLSCQLYQRSADCFLGVPFNIASYALLTHLLAQSCDYEIGDFIHTIGDAHIYINHIEQVKLQLTRLPYPLPKIVIKPKRIFDYTIDDIQIQDYSSYPTIKGRVSV